MPSILATLATRYAAAKAGRRGAVRDFLIDYEELLRLAGARDGDARELAAAALIRAEAESGGLLVIDRHPRSGIPGQVRVAAVGGEAWLFARAGLAAPATERETLADWFRNARLTKVPAPFANAWRAWLERLTSAALAGESVEPFKRGDLTGARELIEVVVAVLNWRGESLLPYASAVICGDSKRLKALEGRVVRALAAITGEEVGLERFGIIEKPREVWFHGPLECVFRDGNGCDFSRMPGAVGLSEVNLDAVAGIRTEAPLCLTVENEAVFLELVKRNPGVLMIRSGFAGSAVIKLLARLPEDMRFRHFGDTDASGFDILRDLRERSGRNFAPLLMEPDSTSGTSSLDSRDMMTLDRLMASPLMSDVRDRLIRYREAGVKGRFEQELVPIELVLDALSCDVRS